MPPEDAGCPADSTYTKEQAERARCLAFLRVCAHGSWHKGRRGAPGACKAGVLPHPEGLGHARGASCPAQPVALGFCRRRAGAVPHQGSACCYNYSPRKSSPRCRTRLSQAALPAWQGAEGFIWFYIYDINYGGVASRSQTPGGLLLRCGDLGESLAMRCWLWAAQGGPRSHPANIPPVSCQQRAGSLPSSTSRDTKGCSCTLRALCMAAGFSSAA